MTTFLIAEIHVNIGIGHEFITNLQITVGGGVRQGGIAEPVPSIDIHLGHA